MTVYVVAQLKFTNVEFYRRYQEAFPAVWKKYRGRLLAADERPMVVEGEWDKNKLVLLSFPDEAAYREWADSEEYQAISKDRTAGAETISLLVQGIA